jgi:endonuclease YncB( thermonuclease family)
LRGGALAAAAASAMLAAAATATELRGRVVDVVDGDTVTLLDAGGRQHRICIAGIDAPERGQPGAYRSKSSLAALVLDQPVRVEPNGGRQDCLAGQVRVAAPQAPCRGVADCPTTLDAGLAQIASGRAWWAAGAAAELSPPERARYESAEREARAGRAGLWRDGTAVPPWQWRAVRRRPGN